MAARTRTTIYRLACLSALGLALLIILPLRAGAQAAGRDALSMFPADTQQFAYSDLSQLRTLPQYSLLKSRLLSPQILSLEDSLRPAGVNPETDVQEIVLGWRGEVQDTTRFFGIAEGSFDTDQLRQYFINNRLPYQRYQGYDLFGFGSGAPRTELFFTFLSASTAAFGRLTDLKALLDVQTGMRPALASSSEFTDWEGELEGTAPQWGIATGKAAANEAIPWLTAGKKIQVDPTALFGPVKAVLYRVNWSDSLHAHLSVLCQSTQSAAGLGQLFTLLQNSSSSPSSTSTPLGPAVSQILQNLQVQVSGSRVEIDATAPISALAQLLNNPSPSSAP